MSQTDAYRRIMSAMPDDAEVVALCRKHIDAADSRASETRANFERVRQAMANHADPDDAVSAKELAEEMADPDWGARKVSWYLSHQDMFTKVVVKGQPNRYYL